MIRRPPRWRLCGVCESVHHPDAPAGTCDDVLRYRELLRAAPPALECCHGAPLGQVVRPWCGTPACAECRRRRMTWRRLSDVMASPDVTA